MAIECFFCLAPEKIAHTTVHMTRYPLRPSEVSADASKSVGQGQGTRKSSPPQIWLDLGRKSRIGF